jgi:hypothetical protein
MNLTGVHFLLSYQCTYACDHCFVWGSPEAKGTMTLKQVRDVLRQAKELGTVTSIYFEGGEPFLFYPIMLEGLREAGALGFQKGIVSNAYWATSVEDAVEWLRPIAEIGINDLSLSSDLFHGDEVLNPTVRNATEAARRLGIPEGVITIDIPEGCSAYEDQAKGAPIQGGSVQFRGRAVATLTEGVPRRPWTDFTECPSEDFINPGRVHVDAYGYVHGCQGLVIGNLWQTPLKALVEQYHPATHPIIGPLLEGGPVALVERYDLAHEATYIDACHLCYLARDALRTRFTELLAPAQVYGEF